MEYSKEAEKIIKEIINYDIFQTTESANEKIKYLNNIYNELLKQCYSKAMTQVVPENTRFKFLKKVICKLIKPHTSQQVDYNYRIIELIKAQQNIIDVYHNIISELLYEKKELKLK